MATMGDVLKKFQNNQVQSVDFDEITEGRGFKPPLPPEDYTFQLPKDLSREQWEPFTAKVGERVKLVIENLLVVKSPTGEFDGETRRYRVTNLERNRAKKGNPEVLISDMDRLLKALGEKENPKTNHGYIKALCQHGGKLFGAATEFQASCNEKQTIWIQTGEGKYVEDPQGRKGCGSRYYNDTFRVPGGYAERLQCTCGASLRAYSEFSRFWSVPQE